VTATAGESALLTALLRRRGSTGAFRARDDDPPDLETADATAWATLALAVANRAPAERAAASRRLAALQAADGRVATHPLHPGAYSPTSIAILAWSAGDGDETAAARARAVDFLLEHRGATFPRDPAGAVRIDSEIAGWPWIDRTFSWAEPTALALLALAAAGRGEHERCHDGVRLLLDRQIDSGGWNYGNSRVFGAELRPAAESTGLVLAALAGRVPRREVERSLAQLEADLPSLRTPLALGWSFLAAGAWQLPSVLGDREHAIDETLARAGRYGGYETADLALLLVARAAPRGLLAALAAAGAPA
jgi:hypothetical protein